MKWCCAAFEGLSDSAGHRGLSVIVGTLVGDRFILQARAVDAGSELGSVGVPVTVAEQQVIFFCPGCGVDLAQFYAHSRDAMRREELVLR